MRDVRELVVGVKTDPVFGPVISFGAGGTMVEVMHDAVVALPPLNGPLAAMDINRWLPRPMASWWLMRASPFIRPAKKCACHWSSGPGV